jgi:hypothetical protein
MMVVMMMTCGYIIIYMTMLFVTALVLAFKLKRYM